MTGEPPCASSMHSTDCPPAVDIARHAPTAGRSASPPLCTRQPPLGCCPSPRGRCGSRLARTGPGLSRTARSARCQLWHTPGHAPPGPQAAAALPPPPRRSRRRRWPPGAPPRCGSRAARAAPAGTAPAAPAWRPGLGAPGCRGPARGRGAAAPLPPPRAWPGTARCPGAAGPGGPPPARRHRRCRPGARSRPWLGGARHGGAKEWSGQCWGMEAQLDRGSRSTALHSGMRQGAPGRLGRAARQMAAWGLGQRASLPLLAAVRPVLTSLQKRSCAAKPRPPATPATRALGPIGRVPSGRQHRCRRPRR